MPLGRTLAIVLALHAGLGAGLFALAQTEVGQQMLKTYHVKLGQEEKPPEPPKQEEAPPPPPPPSPVQEAPPVAQNAAPAAAALAAPQVGGGDGALHYGGKFAGPAGGPLGGFHASVERTFRSFYQQPAGSAAAAILELDVAGSGAVRSYRLARSSGNPENDQAVLAAADRMKSQGVAAPPGGNARRVQVKVTPY